MKLSKKTLNKRESSRGYIKGTSNRPRLSVFRSNNHIYAQVIDDSKFHTLASYSTLNLNDEEIFIKTNTCESAKIIGKKLGEFCIKNNINQVVFDRGIYIYHGRIKALADGLRLSGLLF
jgi:large subunit ribosomal protein L18